jgi:hypothetical protein
MHRNQYYADMQGKGRQRNLRNVKKLLLNEKESAGEEIFC